LKKKYFIFHQLVSHIGFGWDEDWSMPTADKNVWEKYLEKHPEILQKATSTLLAAS
jgi:hypothetical protein